MLVGGGWGAEFPNIPNNRVIIAQTTVRVH